MPPVIRHISNASRSPGYPKIRHVAKVSEKSAKIEAKAVEQSRNPEDSYVSLTEAEAQVTAAGKDPVAYANDVRAGKVIDSFRKGVGYQCSQYHLNQWIAAH